MIAFVRTFNIPGTQQTRSAEQKGPGFFSLFAQYRIRNVHVKKVFRGIKYTLLKVLILSERKFCSSKNKYQNSNVRMTKNIQLKTHNERTLIINFVMATDIKQNYLFFKHCKGERNTVAVSETHGKTTFELALQGMKIQMWRKWVLLQI